MDAKSFFKTQTGFNFKIVNDNIADINHDESMQFHSGANCVNWLLGHIIYGRNIVIKILEKQPVWDEEKMVCYSRGVKAADYMDSFISFDELKSYFNKTQQIILEAIDNADVSNAGKDLAGLALHEIYHSGQIGYCRRLLGKEGKIK